MSILIARFKRLYFDFCDLNYLLLESLDMKGLQRGFQNGSV
tara:strand:+ start:2926 stop:3048 length:123 start_codon:yes stop_codon:yes gene_type:complete